MHSSKYTFKAIGQVCILALLILVSGCGKKVTSHAVVDDGKIEIAIVQINDVYEIGGVNGGKQGNLARVAAYYQDIKKQYPNAMLVLAGDFLNPSLINTMKYNGERVRGKSMIETLNVMGLDLAAFGNHEFDLSQEDLQKRLDESTFEWISTNMATIIGHETFPLYRNQNGTKYFFPKTIEKTFRDADGTAATIGIFSATIDSNPREYIQYFNPDSCASLAIDELNKTSDILIGLTHLAISGDMALAKKEPSIDLIMGGHEHDNMLHEIGPVRITKADANAKTLYLHILEYDKTNDNLNITSKLIDVNEKLRADPKTQIVIDKWNTILEENISGVIADPYKVVFTTTEPLDARESTIRHKQSNLGELISKAMLAASQKDAVAAFVNSGSVRLDDQLSGELTGIDIFRILPFGGSIVDVNIKGGLLKGVLDYGMKSTGQGAFLQYTGIRLTDNGWYIAGEPLDESKYYPIVTSDFLMKGYDIPFLKPDNPAIKSMDEPKDASDPRYDIRTVIIDYLSQ